MALFIPGPAGRLEALLWQAKGEDGAERAPRAAALVCHPHPQGGGTMHNNVVFRTARGLQTAGLNVVRINFRGVEQSEGVHHGQGGEIEDARAGIDWLAREFPGLPLWAAGFSFGSRTVAALALEDARIVRLICVTVPTLAYDCSFLARVRQPGLCLLAEHDEFGNLADLRARVPDLPATLETDEIPGVAHFFKGATPAVEARIRAYALRNLESHP